MRKITLIIIASFVLCHSSIHAQITEEDLMENIQGVVDSKVGLYGMEGTAVAVVFPSENVRTITSGYASSISTPVDITKKWHWASVTKPLTGYIILDMYEENLLDINDPISNYIDTDTIVNVSGDILIKDLLQHTSPLQDIWSPNHTSLWNAVWNDRPRVWEPWEVLSYMPLPDNTNTTHNYNDSNTYLLGFIIEAISGQDLETVFEDRIFTPLSMSNSYLSSSKPFDMTEINGVWSGSENRSSWNHNSYLSSRGGNSALISSITDVATFYNKYYKDDLLTTGTMDMLRIPANGSTQNLGAIECVTSLTTYYGFETQILEITTLDGTFFMYGHNGNGVNNVMAYHWPEEDITLVISTNDFTTLNTIIALYADILCEIISQLPIQSLNVNNAEEMSSIVFPNPVKDYLTVKTQNISTANNWLALYDLHGRTVLKKNIDNKTTRIPLSNLSSGLFVYELNINGQKETGKIIKN